MSACISALITVSSFSAHQVLFQIKSCIQKPRYIIWNKSIIIFSQLFKSFALPLLVLILLKIIKTGGKSRCIKNRVLPKDKSLMIFSLFISFFIDQSSQRRGDIFSCQWITEVTSNLNIASLVSGDPDGWPSGQSCFLVPLWLGKVDVRRRVACCQMEGKTAVYKDSNRYRYSDVRRGWYGLGSLQDLQISRLSVFPNLQWGAASLQSPGFFGAVHSKVWSQVCKN